MNLLKRIITGLASGIVMMGNINVYAQDNIIQDSLVYPETLEYVNDVSDIINTITDIIYSFIPRTYVFTHNDTSNYKIENVFIGTWKILIKNYSYDDKNK